MKMTTTQTAHAYVVMSRCLIESALKRLPEGSNEHTHVLHLLAEHRRVQRLLRPDVPATVPAFVGEMLTILDHLEDDPTPTD